MTLRSKRWIGFALLSIGLGWMVFAQMLIMSSPVAAASEAPLRHFPDQETLTLTESFDLSFALAGDISDGLPNLLIPTVILLWGSYWFHGAHASRREAFERSQPPAML